MDTKVRRDCSSLYALKKKVNMKFSLIYGCKQLSCYHYYNAKRFTFSSSALAQVVFINQIVS